LPSALAQALRSASAKAE